MAESRSWEFSKPSIFKIGAAAAALLLVPASAGFSQPEWSGPELSVHKPSSEVTQNVEITRRNYKESSDQRIIENRMKVKLKTPGLEGDYVLLRKQVYSRNRIVTFYREMEADLRGQAAFAVSERTQVSKNQKGDFKGTLMREYFAGEKRHGPAVRVMLHYDPYLVARKYTAKVSAGDGNGAWRMLASSQADSLRGAIEGARRRLASSRSPEPLADFIIGLWSGALAHQSSMEMAQFVYPLLGPSGDQYMQDIKIEPVMERSQAAAAKLGGGPELGHWQSLARNLALDRSALEKILQKQAPAASAGPFDPARRYIARVKSLMETRPGQPPSPLLGLQASTGWLAAAFQKLSLMPEGSAEYKEYLSSLPGKWISALSPLRREVYLRALYVLLMSREGQGLDPLISGAASQPQLERDLKTLKEDLAAASRAWRTPMARLERPSRFGTFFALLNLPFRLLVPEAWAAAQPAPSADSFFDIFFENSGFSSSLTDRPIETLPVDLSLGELAVTIYRDHVVENLRQNGFAMTDFPLMGMGSVPPPGSQRPPSIFTDPGFTDASGNPELFGGPPLHH